MLVVYEAAAIWFVMRYAARVKADPAKSLMANNHWDSPDIPDMEEAQPLTGKQKMILVLLHWYSSL